MDGGKLELTPELVKHALMMQELRNWYRKPLNVNSWYRTKTFNKKVGGGYKLLHLDGIASDIALPNLTSNQITNFINKWKGICYKHKVIGGVSVYKWGLHFDSNNDPNRYGRWSSSFRTTDFR